MSFNNNKQIEIDHPLIKCMFEMLSPIWGVKRTKMKVHTCGVIVHTQKHTATLFRNRYQNTAKEHNLPTHHIARGSL